MTQYQKFEVKEVHRSEIKNAPYNPRVITDKAMSMLKKNIKQKGLLTTLVWNQRTGHLVSGHQRLKVLDFLEKSEDYTISVAVVDLDLKAEKEQNLFFNSTTPQGQFDSPMLMDVLKDVDPFASGFDEADLNIIGYDFTAEALVTEVQKGAEQDVSDFFKEEEEEEEKPAFTADQIKAEKKRIIDQAASRMDEGERYVSIVFDTYSEKAAWMKKMGFNPDDLFIRFALIENKFCDE